MKVDFVDSHQEEHGVQPILRALQGTPAAIAPSTYYAAKTRPASARSRRDEELTRLIKQIHAENYGVYGARKIWHEVLRRGVRVARCTVERLMREAGLRGLLRDKSLIERMFQEIEVGKVYTGKVVSITNFGAFMEVLPGKDGLIHVSELAEGRMLCPEYHTTVNLPQANHDFPIEVPAAVQ